MNITLFQYFLRIYIFCTTHTLCYTNLGLESRRVKKKCIDRESNPGPYLCPFGKVRCYHYTINAVQGEKRRATRRRGR